MTLGNFRWKGRHGESLSPCKLLAKVASFSCPLRLNNNIFSVVGSSLPFSPVSPHAGLSKRLCEFRSLLVNELASDTYLLTLILDVMHPCHFPTVCPKRLSDGHKSRGSKVS